MRRYWSHFETHAMGITIGDFAMWRQPARRAARSRYERRHPDFIGVRNEASALDPITVAIAGAALFVMSLLAAMVPVLHAISVDPARTLREE